MSVQLHYVSTGWALRLGGMRVGKGQIHPTREEPSHIHIYTTENSHNNGYERASWSDRNSRIEWKGKRLQHRWQMNRYASVVCVFFVFASSRCCQFFLPISMLLPDIVAAYNGTAEIVNSEIPVQLQCWRAHSYTHTHKHRHIRRHCFPCSISLLARRSSQYCFVLSPHRFSSFCRLQPKKTDP